MPALSRPRPTIVLALLTLVVLATVPLALRAQAPTPDAPTVWGVDANALLKVDAAGATVLFEATGGGGHALAVDPVHQVVWTYQGAELRAYDFAGTWLRTITLTNASNTTPGPLAVNPEDGSVWVSYTHRSGTGETALEHRDAQGQLLVSRPEGADHLAVDASRGRVWAARATTLQALDAAGQVVLTLDLAAADPAGGPARGLAVDPATGRLWVVRDDTVVRYGAAGALDLVIPLPAHPVDPTPERWVARDGQGGVWAATPTALFRFDGAGTLLAEVNPWPGSTDPTQPTLLTALAAEPATHAAWVATALFTRATAAWSTPADLVQIGAAGQALQQRRLREAGGTDRVSALAFSGPEPRPEVVILAPADGSTVGTGTPTLELEYRSVGAGLDPTTLEVTADGQPWAVACTHAATGATCTPAAALTDGPHTLTVTVADVAGQPSTPAVATITVDTVPPVVTLTAPVDGALTNVATQAVRGEVSEAATLVVRHNGQTVETVPVASAGAFDASPVTLVEGANALEVVALDAAGHTGQASAQVTLDTAAPPALAASAVRVEILPDDQVRVTGAAGSVEPGTWVRVTNLRTGISVLVQAAADGSFTLTIGAEPGDRLEVTSTDAAQNTSAATEVVAAPPDPALVAPALDRTVATDLKTATAFLYTGEHAIQVGVDPNTIESRRVAVLRGTVRTRDGAPLPGVTITVLGHPEFGTTWSRADGAFDLAVNGGGVLTVTYAKPGYLPAHRQVQAPWQDYAHLADVVLLALDPEVTPIASNAPAMQVARGQVVEDGDGSRQATVLFPAGTAATLVLPDGTTQPLTTLHVRATEYTVDATGPAAMPADLPATSGYTYAVELSVDEALAAGATSVQFSQPVASYTENFLDFPVGSAVPVGTYDRVKAAWVPEPNGRVVKILRITNGLAELDVTGSGTAADAATLAALGVTDAERTELARLYPEGQSLWRVALTHFSTEDYNWGIGCQPGPQQACTAPTHLLTGFHSESKPTRVCRSIIGCQNQTLGEALALTGTPLRLHYESDRVPGRRAAYTLDIPVSGPTLPPGVTRIVLDVAVAGWQVRQSFSPLPNQRIPFTWDGLDAYGRPVQGEQTITIRLGYVYAASYQQPAQAARSFALLGAGAFSFIRARQEIIFWQTVTDTIGTWDARAAGLGGWTLDVHHAYDRGARALWEGSGQRRSATDIGQVIETLAGTGASGFSGDEGPATAATFRNLGSVAVDAQGVIYVADMANNRIRRIDLDGTITTVAGTGQAGYNGDGILATQAHLNTAPNGGTATVGPDGSLYIADRANHRVRRVDPQGIISTVAGTGVAGFSGDGGPATAAQFNFPSDVTVDPSGALLITDWRNHRVRRVSPDGRVMTIAGTGVAGFSGDGGPATLARLNQPGATALDAAGNLYIADGTNQRIRKVGPDGIISTVAGTGVAGFSGDGLPATQAQLFNPLAVAVDTQGTLYIGDYSNHRVRAVGPDGRIRTVVGIGTAGFSGDGGPALAAGINGPARLAVDPQGALYIADFGNARVRRVRSVFPTFVADRQLVPSEDGGALHVFDDHGRHLRTVDARTGAELVAFSYDPAGRLTGVQDRAGLVTTIERDAAGQATAIVAPGGQRTALTVNPEGYLTQVANPAGQAVQLAYHTGGLLATLTDAKGQVARFTYDAQGRLSRDDDRAGGYAALTRTETATSYTVQLTTGEGRTSTYQVERLPAGETRRIDTDAAGLRATLVRHPNGTRSFTAPDGSVTSVTDGPDSRFGMQAPLAKSATVKMPSGLQQTVTQTRAVALATPGDPLSLTALTETVTVNGRAYTSTYSAATRTITTRTPAGRQTVMTLDALGRVVTVERPGLEPVSLAYDGRGRLETVTEGTGAAARVTTYGYDTLDRLISLRDPLTRTVGFGYDLADRVTVQTRPDTEAIGFGYDTNGNLTAVTPPGRPAHTFGYTPVDLEASYTPPAVPDVADPVTSSTYNTDTQPTLVTRPDGQTLGFGYDTGGRLATLTQPRGTTTLGYDATRGTLTSVTAPDGGTLAYTYDGSLLKSVTWGSGPVTGSVAWTYDADFRVATEAVNGAQSVTYTYDPDSLVTGAGALALARDPQTGFLTGTTLGAVSDSRTYTPFGEPETYRADVNGTQVLQIAYVRNAFGRITEKTETLEGVTTVTAYRYDAVGRLDRVTVDGVATATYTYDANGNRVSATTPSGTETGTYDTQDRLLSYGAATYTYTANGELRTKTDASGTTTYTYDLVGNLTRVDLPDDRVIEYLIDGQNRRIGKKVDGVLVQGWLYRDQLKPVAELDGSGQVVARFVYGSNPLVPDYVIKGGVTYRILSDHLSSPRLVVDTATGLVVQHRDYDAWGVVTLDTSPGFQPFGFAGGLDDPATGLVRFGTRDYEPRIGRWTAKDSIFRVTAPNQYAYAADDPANLVDPYGLFEGPWPPAPPGYDPSTWKWGRYPDGKEFLRAPNGDVYLPHREDETHWRHWDIKDSDDKDKGRWPKNSGKPRNDKGIPQRRLKPHQCRTDPSGDAPELVPPEGTWFYARPGEPPLPAGPFLLIIPPHAVVPAPAAAPAPVPAPAW